MQQQVGHIWLVVDIKKKKIRLTLEPDKTNQGTGRQRETHARGRVEVPVQRHVCGEGDVSILKQQSNQNGKISVFFFFFF